jgi:hypothetical protein
MKRGDLFPPFFYLSNFALVVVHIPSQTQAYIIKGCFIPTPKIENDWLLILFLLLDYPKIKLCPSNRKYGQVVSVVFKIFILHFIELA